MPSPTGSRYEFWADPVATAAGSPQLFGAPSGRRLEFALEPDGAILSPVSEAPARSDTISRLWSRCRMSSLPCHRGEMERITLGGSAGGRPVGSLADLSTFSFHPVKVMTTAEAP